MAKWVYRFDDDVQADKYVLGGKGANLADMTKAGLPVPPGFTLPTSLCHVYLEQHALPDAAEAQIKEAVAWLEAETGKKFGGPGNPLLVSVRSGAPISMPGMMDTVLNLGLNDTTVKALADTTNNPRFAYDCYRRFIQMFGDVVLGIPHYEFESVLEAAKEGSGVKEDQDLSAEQWLRVISTYKKVVERAVKHPFPQDPMEQLRLAIGAVFESWGNHRAVIYRKVHKIPDTLGTAVNVQSMVFGNMGSDSGTGVAFTRNPSTGEKRIFGEYLINAQGEDVVAGIRTPKPISSLSDEMPGVYEQFVQVCHQLENYYQDVQDIEFTVERGTLYMLQTRNAKRTAEAAVRIAVELAEEGIIDKKTAVGRVNPEQLDQLLHPAIDAAAEVVELAKGLPASPGAASGGIVFDADDAEQRAKHGEKVILVRMETTPEDIHGILAAEGILTSRGGMTSHAAVVARGMGKPCICGCDALRIDAKAKTLTIGAEVFHEGDQLTIDGATGRVLLGNVPKKEPTLSAAFERLLQWADEIRNLGVRANADNPEDAQKARQFGAGGIGLCRTEHMFMAADRVPIVQKMILAGTLDERKQALSELLPMQEGDFYGILEAMDGLPVTIRLLDPPLHEFLPNLEQLIAKQTELQIRREYEPQNGELKQQYDGVTAMLARVKVLHEMNPMLGHRGCRLAVTFPEIYEMQVQAIFQATARLIREGKNPKPEVMIPLVGHVEELRRMRKLVQDAAATVCENMSVTIPCVVGTMIEVPRAALTAGDIAHEAEFFSFGTNDLTQTTFGFSRDDAEGKFLHTYVAEKILKENPFAVIDEDGVGQLVHLGTTKGRQVKPDLKVGICGEHGGDPKSIQFCHKTGLDYVSCSPYRVPLARLAAAQAAL